MRRAARTTARSVQPSSPVSQQPAAVVDAIADEFGGRVTVAPTGARLTVTGWAIDAGAVPFEQVEIAIGGARAAGGFTQRRPDVAAALGSPEAVGFRLELVLHGAALGHHPAGVTGIRANGGRVAIPVAASLDVVAPLREIVAGVREGELQGALDEVRAEGRPAAAPGEPVLAALDATIVLRGWAASPRNVPASLAYAQLDGGPVVRGMAGHARPDVASALGTERADYGFRIRVAARDLGLGEHTLRALAIAEDRIGPIGEPVTVTVGDRFAAAVHPRGDRLRGRIELVGRLGEDTAVREELKHLRLAAGERAVLTGWSGDPVRGTLPGRVVLAVDGAAHGTVQRGIERDDVVRATDCPGLARSGFSAVIRADRLGAGFHRAEIIAFFGDAPVVLDAVSFEVGG
jgi:hypothetical protein